MIAVYPQHLDIQAHQSLKPYFFTVVYRLTGSASDAEDTIQDAWIRYLDAGSRAVTSLRACLTTIVSRLWLDCLKSARVRREQYTGSWLPEPVLTATLQSEPEHEAEIRESVSMTMLTLVDHLSPDQRVVYILRESYDVPYEEIALLVDKHPSACRHGPVDARDSVNQRAGQPFGESGQDQHRMIQADASSRETPQSAPASPRRAHCSTGQR